MGRASYRTAASTKGIDSISGGHTPESWRAVLHQDQLTPFPSSGGFVARDDCIDERGSLATIAFRRNVFDAFSARDNEIVRLVSDLLELGQPARYLIPPAVVEWFVFDDHRFKPTDIAYQGCLAVHSSQIPPGYQVPMLGGQVDRAQLTQDTKAFCDARGVVLPKDIVFTENGNLWQEILDAQGTPGFLQMADSVPDNWVPVVEEP